MNNQISKERLEEVKEMRARYWCNQHPFYFKVWAKTKIAKFTKKEEELFEDFVEEMLKKYNWKVEYLPFNVFRRRKNK